MERAVGSTRRALLFAIAVPLATAQTPELKKFEGVLIDKESSYIAETRVAAGGRLEGGILNAYTHTKKELLMPENRKSGYGVFTYDDQKFLPFDTAGNAKALQFIQATAKQDDFRVVVTGRMDGEKLKVASIKMLP